MVKIGKILKFKTDNLKITICNFYEIILAFDELFKILYFSDYFYPSFKPKG